MTESIPPQKWYCTACEVGMAERFRPICWSCRSADAVVPALQFNNPCSSAWRSPMLQRIADEP